MVYYNQSNQEEDYDSKLLYDLRQNYANNIQKYFSLILLYKETKNYREWFRTLVLMKPLVLGRVTRKAKETKEDYELAIENISVLTQEYKKDFFGQTKTDKGIGEIENALLDLEYFIVYVMEKNGFWGSGREDRGL